ncbi:hydroxymethylglutaryl-CoA reductase, degradative [Streptococcus porcorum]|uniref:3-hydroxy-3-methylglutaryl coenzyme A reductase n=1 Tax=Streptococcus porcorum TaxID=701526 RepID=A0ABV2JEU4_9STRE
MNKQNWTGFSKKTILQRIEHLEKLHFLTNSSSETLYQHRTLPLETADQMVENVLTTYNLPYALAPDFLVDGKTYQLPMVTEEPSVVAAASYAAKIIKRSGGFQTTIQNRQMIGQVALYQVPDLEQAKKDILANKEHLLQTANAAHPSIVKRGGGACDLRLDFVGNDPTFLVVYLIVDTKEAMGANIINTMMEALTLDLEQLSGGKSLMAILSNYATESLVTAQCTIDLRYLSRNKDEALELGQKMALASQLAQVDVYRASTHNKGIFNGIDALVLATGNDWRAIEAGGHAYACRNGQYQGLSSWHLDEQQHQIIGQLTLPMPIATKGGSIGLNPNVALSFDLLGQPDAKTLARLIVSLGLAQNFAALKALTSSGIQAGHMKLQAKSLALLAGASEKEVPLLVPQLLKSPHLNLETAQELLEKIRQ